MMVVLVTMMNAMTVMILKVIAFFYDSKYDDVIGDCNINNMSIVIIICITTTVIFYQSYALNSVIIIITLQPEKTNADILTTEVPIKLHER